MSTFQIVFHPSYFAPLDGEFHIETHNGNSMNLKCTAKLGQANVQVHIVYQTFIWTAEPHLTLYYASSALQVPSVLNMMTDYEIRFSPIYLKNI